MTALIETRDLAVGYGARAVVSGLALHVEPGEVVSLFGPNGAGKTTTLLTLAGALVPISGQVVLFGDLASSPLHMRVRQGLAFITDERSMISNLTARDNLRLRGGSVDRALEIFPELEEHLDRPAALLSGGQQQMLAVARSLASQPRLLLADELSLGLAPLLVQRLLKAVRAAADQGVGVLLVEQHVAQALAISDRAYLLGQGTVALEGSAELLKERLDDVAAAYLKGHPASHHPA